MGKRASSSKEEDDEAEPFDEDGEHPEMPDAPTDTSQSATDREDTSTDLITDQIGAQEFEYDEPSQRLTRIPTRLYVFIDFGDRGLYAILCFEWIPANHARIILSSTQPFHVNYPHGFIQNEHETIRTAVPWDSLHLLVPGIFSPTITEHSVYPRESEGVQETQPNTMPTPIIILTNDENIPMANTNTPVTTDITIQATLEQSITPILQNAPNGQGIVGDSSSAHTPAERPHDTDLSEDTVDHPDSNEDIHNSKQRCRLETVGFTHGGDKSMNTGAGEGQTSIHPGNENFNNENITRSNATTVNPEQLATPDLKTNSSSAESSDVSPNIDAPQIILHDIPSPVVPDSKTPLPIESNIQSASENTQE